MSRNRNGEPTPSVKQVAFRTMEKTYKECIGADNFIAAYVIAFSFLEDRVTAMDVALGRPETADPAKYWSISDRLKRVKKSGDVSGELALRIAAAAKERNILVHKAMWKLSVFSAEGASGVYQLAREADAARGKQTRRLKVR